MYDIALLQSIILILLIVFTSTYLSLLERHLVAMVQQRVGPTATGLGLLQPLADAFKLLTKEPTRPYRSRFILFRLSPIITFSLAITIWTVIPISSSYVYCQSRSSLLVILVFLTFNNYAIVLGAWASYNKYALFSVYRSIALTGSYGVSISLIFLLPGTLSHSINLYDITLSQLQLTWYIWPSLPIAVIFWIVLLTEVKKIPFDVTESETELGSGYLIEYAGMGFALFIIAEYCYILILSTLFVLLFLGGWLYPPIGGTLFKVIPEFIWFLSKIAFCLFWYLLTRSTLPNYRFDYIMTLHWRILFPTLLVLTITSISFIFWI